jgi:peroxiredoxin Q/BCP
MKAIDFKLLDQNGTGHTLKQYRGKWVVLYFYPKDDTPGCTVEACTFRDSLLELQKLGVVILGVSKDSVASHKKFADKYHLNFPILSDESKETIKAYDAWGGLGTRRKTYLIDQKGEIKKVYNNVNPTIHAGEILRDLTASAESTD